MKYYEKEEIKTVPVQDAVGKVLLHDITKIVSDKESIFDLVVPRLLAGEKVSKADIEKLGHGGICSNCLECRLPSCNFGK